MIDQKIFETTLNIDDPTNFCTNVEAHLLKELENIYVGKCFKNSFILNITGVIQRSLVLLCVRIIAEEDICM